MYGAVQRDVLHVVAPSMSRHARARLIASSSLIGSVLRQAFHRAIDAQFLGQRASIDFADAGDAVLEQIIVQRDRAAPVADTTGESSRTTKPVHFGVRRIPRLRLRP